MLVLDLLIIGLAITLNPIPLTAFILIVASRNGVRKGAAFIFGWLVSLAVVASLTVALTGNQPPKENTVPSLTMIAIKIAIGAVLVLIAFRRWRRLGRPKPPKKAPGWQEGIDNMSLWFAMALGPLTQPWGLVMAGVTVITGAHLEGPASYVALIVFCILATALYLATDIYALVQPEETQVVLARIRLWLNTHTDQVIIVVSLVLGLWLVASGLRVVL